MIVEYQFPGVKGNLLEIILLVQRSRS